ncbi:MAG: NYN domain-containing protein [Candidatus Sumerlaeaceae bacterium]|nr:NYN domain-containing protein [Candidatus Sumerlaeaceae bacterium]
MTMRVGVFIDIQNIYLTTKQVFRDGRVNFETLRSHICSRKDAIVILNAFTCYDPGNSEQIKFINALGLLGYRVITKPIRRLPDNTIKANMDLEMALEVLSQASVLDEIVLVTGDGDFKALVDYLARQGKVVRVIGPRDLTSPDLIQSCHIFENLHDIPGIRDLSQNL